MTSYKNHSYCGHCGVWREKCERCPECGLKVRNKRRGPKAASSCRDCGISFGKVSRHGHSARCLSCGRRYNRMLYHKQKKLTTKNTKTTKATHCTVCGISFNEVLSYRHYTKCVPCALQYRRDRYDALKNKSRKRDIIRPTTEQECQAIWEKCK